MIAELQLKERLNFKGHHEYLMSISQSQWTELLNTYFVNANYVCIRAFPSIEEKDRLSSEETSRIEEQRTQLGEEGLKEKEELLKRAKELNDVPPPSSMLTKIPVPSIDCITYHYLRAYKSNEVSNVENVFNFTEIPIYTEVYDVRTSFTYVSNIFSTI